MAVISGGRVLTGHDRRDVRWTRRGIYSFAASGNISAMGGAVSAIDLVDENGKPIVFEDNDVIERATITAHTVLTSGGAATVALGSSEAGKGAVISAAVAFDDPPYDDVGLALHAAALVTAPYKVTGTGKKLTATIAGAALTAGKFEVVLHGYTAAG